MIALALFLAAAPAAPSLASAPALFQRAEPSLEAGARALAAGDVDGAIEKFRRAQPESDDERAIVEYDVGSALLARAALAAAPAEGGTPSQHAPDQGGAQDAPAGPDTAALDDARAAFERAYGIAKDRRLKSEAALASGNAAAFASKLDDAIAEYRKSVVADPSNARAKTNLKRALDAKRAQPPPPPSPDDQGGDGDEKDEPKDPKDGDEPKDPKDGDEPKGDKGDKPKDDKPKDDKGDKPKDDEGDGKKPEPKDGDKKPEEGKGAQKKKLKKEEAKRLLEMMRSRERPLTPMEMRGEEKKQTPKQGKDW